MHALFASTFSLGKMLASYSQPIFLVGIRMFCAGSLLLIYEYFKQNYSWKLHQKHFWYFVQISIFTTLPHSLRFWAFRSDMTASKASLLYNLSPFITYIFSCLLRSEKLTIKKVIGLTIGFLGFFPTVLPAIRAEYAPYVFLSLPDIAILASITCLSYGWIITHRLIKMHNYTATTINSISMFSGGLLALIISLIFESGSFLIEAGHFGTFLIILTIVIIVSNLFCNNLYVILLKTYSPTFISFSSFLSPLFTAMYDWAFLNETIPGSFWVTGACVLIGLGVFYYDDLYGDQLLLKTNWAKSN